LNKAKICRLALSDNNKPYVIPMNFGFREDYLYLHSAHEGKKKIDILRKNNNVCFEVDMETELMTLEKACGCGMKYLSVIGLAGLLL